MVYFLSRSVNTWYQFSSTRWSKRIRISVLGWALVSTIFLSQCGCLSARSLWELIHPPFFLSYPIHYLLGLRGDFRHIFYHRLGLHPLSFLPSCLCGVALEPFRRRVVRRFVDICHCFGFRSDKLHQRNWSGKLLWGGSRRATYHGSFRNEFFQSHHGLSGDYFWSLQEYHRQGLGPDTHGLSPAYTWEEFTNFFEGIVAWQSSVLYVGIFTFPNLPRTCIMVTDLHLESLWELL